MDLEKVRKQENIEMARHIKSVYDLIEIKCSRCHVPSCQGCVFSTGEMLYDLYHIVDLLRIYDFDACLKGFNMDKFQFDNFFEEYEKMYNDVKGR